MFRNVKSIRGNERIFCHEIGAIKATLDHRYSLITRGLFNKYFPRRYSSGCWIGFPATWNLHHHVFTTMNRVLYIASSLIAWAPLGFDKYAFVALSRSFFSSSFFFLSLLTPSLCERRFCNECSELLVNFRLARGERHRLLIIVNGFINNRSCRSSRRTTRKYRACRGWFFKIAARAAIEKGIGGARWNPGRVFDRYPSSRILISLILLLHVVDCPVEDK